jgi:hypothetical protein
MSNTASKLKPMEMELPSAFVVHLVLASLPKELETFVVNYNISHREQMNRGWPCLREKKQRYMYAAMGIPTCQVPTTSPSGTLYNL